MGLPRWTKDNIPDQNGKTVLITGANAGLGYVSAQCLMEKGAHVILACRNMDKAEAAKAKLDEAAPNGSCVAHKLDLSDLEQVKESAASLVSSLTSLDVLMLNAGIMIPPESKTAQGYELQFGVNHLGHFAFALLLLPLLEKTKASRIVTVSSLLHRDTPGLDLDDICHRKKGYQAWRAYCDTKLCNLLFMRELNTRLGTSETAPMVLAAHPGYSSTNLLTSPLMRVWNFLAAQSAEKGALAQIRAAVDPEAKRGDFYGNNGFKHLWGYPVLEDPKNTAKDDTVAAALWSLSESCTGVTYPQ